MRRFRPGAHRGGLRSIGLRRIARPLRAAALPKCVRACACACSYVYEDVCGWIADGYTPVLECHRAPSTSRPVDVQRTPAQTFSTSCAHISVSTPQSCAACACVCVDVCLCVCGGALHACKLRKSGNILARVLYGCVKMSISLYVCADRPCSHPPLHTYARVWARAAGRACGCCPCVHLARHPCVRYMRICIYSNM